MPIDPYPGDLRAYVLAALPYAGAEALRIAAWCLAVTIPAAAACWLLATASRLARQRQSRRERDLPRLARAIGRVERTRAMPLGDLVISPEQEYAAYKAAAPTEVIEVTPTSFDGLGDVDPDWRLGGDR